MKISYSLCLRLSFLLSAGMPLSTGLALLESQSRGRAREIARSLKESVEEGKTLAEGMGRFPKLWSRAQARSVAAGESSGRLREELERVAEDQERARALRGKVIGALLYPLVVAGAAIALIAALTLGVFPKILPLILGMQVALPFSTRVVLAASQFTQRYGLEASAALAIAGGGWAALVRWSARAKRAHDAAVLRVPLAGGLLRRYYVARIARLCSSMLESGLTLSTALVSVADAQGNTLYRERLAACAQAVEEGNALASALAKDHRLFPDMSAQLIAAGEASGSLAEMLGFVAAFAERDIDERAKMLSALVEPAIMICLGLIVGFVAVSIIAPIYALTSHLSS